MAKYGTIRTRGYPRTRKLMVHIGAPFKRSICGRSFIWGIDKGESPTCKTCIRLQRDKPAANKALAAQ